MPQAKVTSKGQITIPMVVRDRMGLVAGDRIEFVEEAGEFRLKKHVDLERFTKWLGYLKHLKGCDPDELVNEMRGPTLAEELAEFGLSGDDESIVEKSGR